MWVCLGSSRKQLVGRGEDVIGSIIFQSNLVHTPLEDRRGKKAINSTYANL